MKLIVYVHYQFNCSGNPSSVHLVSVALLFAIKEDVVKRRKGSRVEGVSPRPGSVGY